MVSFIMISRFIIIFIVTFSVLQGDIFALAPLSGRRERRSPLKSNIFSEIISVASDLKKIVTVDDEENLLINTFNNHFYIKKDSIVTGVQKISPLSYLFAAFSNDLMLFNLAGVGESDITAGKIQFSPETEKNNIKLSLSIANQDETNPLMKMDFLGDGRSLRDLKRMNDKVDPRALSDILREMVSSDSHLFPIFPQIQMKSSGLYKIEKVNNGRLITIVLEVDPEETKIEVRKEKKFSIDIKDLKNLKGEGAGYYKVLQKIMASDNFSNWAERNDLSIEYDSFNKPQKLHILTPLIIFEKKTPEINIDISMQLEELVKGELPTALTEKEIFSDYFYHLSRLIHKDSFQSSLDEKNKLFFKMLKDNIDYLRALISEEKLLAGAYTYLSYFGRDTVISYFLLENFISDKLKRILLKSLYNRVRNKGEATHEVDSRIKRDNPLHYDTRMADTDFLLAYAGLDYISKNTNFRELFEAKVDAKRYRESERVPAVFSQFADNLNYILTKIKDLEPVGAKFDHDPSSANWRDALDSMGRLKYPYDINNIWIPMILDKAYQVFSRENKNNILNELIERYGLSPEVRTFFEHPEKLIELKNLWNNKVEVLFAKDLSVEDLRNRLKDFYKHNPEYYEKLKHMPAGYSDYSGRTTYSTADFLNDETFEIINELIKQGEFYLPDGNKFPETINLKPLGLDKNRNIVPVMHSDLSFNSFNTDKIFSKAGDLLPFELPLSLGGLAVVDKSLNSLSFVVANPMLAEAKGHKLLTTPDEDKKNIKGEELNIHSLLGKDTYHGWGAVWGVMSDTLMKGLLKKYNDKTASKDEMKLLSWLFNSYLTIGDMKNYEVLGFDYDKQLKDYRITYSTINNIEVNPLQAWNHAGIISTMFSITDSLIDDKELVVTDNGSVFAKAA